MLRHWLRALLVLLICTVHSVPLAGNIHGGTRRRCARAASSALVLGCTCTVLVAEILLRRVALRVKRRARVAEKGDARIHETRHSSPRTRIPLGASGWKGLALRMGGAGKFVRPLTASTLTLGVRVLWRAAVQP